MKVKRDYRADHGLLLLRFVIGTGLFALHGRDKLSSAYGYLFAGQNWPFVNVVASLGFPFPAFFAVLAALAESAGALAVSAGVLTRIFAAVVAFTMVVASVLHVKGDQPPELATLYLTPMLTLILTGPGRIAIDRVRLNRNVGPGPEADAAGVSA